MKKFVIKKISFAIILHITFLFFAGFMPQRLSAQNEVMAFTKQIAGNGVDVGTGIVVDSKGNVYSTGVFSFITDFDPGPGTNTITSMGALDIFLVKLSPAGNLLWSKQIGGPSDDIAFAIKIDSLDNIYITGTFLSTVDFDPGTTVYSMSTSGSQPDVFIVKIDSAGNFKWGRQVTGPMWEVATELSVDAIGNCHLTGNFEGTVNFDPGNSNFTLTATQQQPYVLKIDSSGLFNWVKTFNSSDWGTGQGITVNRIGEVFIGGTFEGPMDFDPGPGSYTLAPAYLSTDAFIVKLDAAGSFIWAKRFKSDYGCSAECLLLDPSGNLYVSGNFLGTVDFDPSPSTYTLYGSSASFAGGSSYLTKLNPSGGFAWSTMFGAPAGSSGTHGLAGDASGNLYLTGSFNGTIGFNLQPSTFTITSLTSNSDLFVAKFNNSGNLIWAGSAPGNLDKAAFDIVLDKKGNFYLTGTFMGSVDFDITAGTYPLTNVSANTSDVFISKYSCLSPTISAISSNNLCAGETMSLSGAASYTWQPGGLITATLAATSNMTYSVIASNTAGCLSDSPLIFSVTVNQCVGIEKIHSAFNKILFFPNPSQDILNIDIGMTRDKSQVEILIINALGQTCLQTDFKEKIDISKLPSGVYILSILQNGKIVGTDKFIKN